MIRYYFLIATNKFLLEQEPIEEVLRERVRHYELLNKDLDFGVTNNLSFLEHADLAHMKRQITEPSVAIFSINPRFIDWLRLRMQYVIVGSYLSPVFIENNNFVHLKNNNR